MSKIPCSRCGAAILATTAESTGGFCMPCKTGTRERIDARKKEIQREREWELTDPFRRLWLDLVRATGTTAGFAGLSEVEKQYFAVGLLELEVYNGGFAQYFFNSSGSFYRYAVLGLESMGARQALALLQQAKQVVFGSDEVPEATRQRRLLLSVPSDARSERLNVLDRQYYEDPDGLDARSQTFARTHKLV